jgi:Mn-dependent DtxR family transcriptional regulator
MQKENNVLPIAPLEKQGALQILVYLYEKQEKANITEIAENVKSSRETILSTIELLRKTSLVKDEQSVKFPYAHTVWLTEKGREVAKHFLAASHILQRPENTRKNQGG